MTYVQVEMFHKFVQKFIYLYTLYNNPFDHLVIKSDKR